jgi:pyruvate dehydrogenase E1 component alpha subunit
MRCDGMNVLDTYTVVSEALTRVREERRPLLVEAVTYRFRGHSMADPEEYRSKEEVAQWRERDPIPAFAALLEREGMLSTDQREQIDRDALARVDAAVRFAERSPFPEPQMLYEDVYVMDEQVPGHYHADGSENERRVAAAPPPDGATTAVQPAAGAAAVQERA